MSIPFPGDEKPTVIPVGSARRAVGKGANGSLSCRSVELRASGAVGLHGQAVCGFQNVWNRSTRRAVQLQHSLGRTEEKIIRRGTGIDVGKQRDQPNRMTKLAVLVDRMDWQAGSMG